MTHPVVGTIRLEPAVVELAGADDSLLGQLLTSLARHERLATASHSHQQPFRLVATQRLSAPGLADRKVSVRANLAQLVEDLQDEYDQLCHVAF